MVLALPSPVVARLQPDRATALGIALFINILVLGALTLPRELPMEKPALPADETPLVVEQITRAAPVPLPPVPPPPAPPPRQPRMPSLPTPLPSAVGELPAPIDAAISAPVQRSQTPPATAQPAAVSETAVGYGIAPPPAYPRLAVRRGWQGSVVLRVLVAADGRPQQVQIAVSSGHDVLDEAARAQVLARWRFVPAERDGRAVAAWAKVPVEFKLPQ